MAAGGCNGDGDGDGGGNGGGIPIRPLLELAGLRALEAAAKYCLVRVSGETKIRMEGGLRRRLYAALLCQAGASPHWFIVFFLLDSSRIK